MGLASALSCGGTLGNCLPALGVGRNQRVLPLIAFVGPCTQQAELALCNSLLGLDCGQRVFSSDFLEVFTLLMFQLSPPRDLGAGSCLAGSVWSWAQTRTMGIGGCLFLYPSVRRHCALSPWTREVDRDVQRGQSVLWPWDVGMFALLGGLLSSSQDLCAFMVFLQPLM